MGAPAEDNQFQIRTDAHRELTRTLNVTVPFDGLMSAMSGKKVIDPLKLDDNLKAAYGDYEDGKTSMRDFVYKKFGKLAVSQIVLLMSS